MSARIRALLRGVGSVFDLSGEIVFSGQRHVTDEQGFRSDWENIGSDFRVAIDGATREKGTFDRRQLELELQDV